MKRPLARDRSLGPARRGTQTGIVLVEVLVAILMMGLGLLALLTLFPLGALEMAQAIPDDRTGAVAVETVALSDLGKQLISETSSFVEESLSSGSVDAAAAARLREQYERFACEAEALEIQLLKLQSAFPPEQIQPYVGPLFAQIRSIRQRITPLTRLLLLLETSEPDR